MGKGGCPFSLNAAVEIEIGTDRWEIRYKKNESQHVHNHNPSNEPAVYFTGGENMMKDENELTRYELG